MKCKTKTELEREIGNLTKELDRVRKIGLDQYGDICELRNRDALLRQEARAEVERAATVRLALEQEICGLRQELAQSQSALYTLINKLPETL